MSGSSHIDERGEARMVDVGGKTPTRRIARAEALVRLGDAAFESLVSGDNPKGEVLGVARVAGIQAAKKTHELIPLCHLLLIESVQLRFVLEESETTVRVLCEARTTGQTGVEMEALTGASVAALTLYDMLKSVEKGIRIEGLRLLSKEGGKSGSWTAAS